MLVVAVRRTEGMDLSTTARCANIQPTNRWHSGIFGSGVNASTHAGRAHLAHCCAWTVYATHWLLMRRVHQLHDLRSTKHGCPSRRNHLECEAKAG